MMLENGFARQENERAACQASYPTSPLQNRLTSLGGSRGLLAKSSGRRFHTGQGPETLTCDRRGGVSIAPEGGEQEASPVV